MPKSNLKSCSKVFMILNLSDSVSLRELAQDAKSLYAMYATVDLSLDNLVIATVRVVRDDGVLMRAPKTIRLPLGKDKFSDVSRVALAKAIAELELETLPKVRTVVAVKETPVIEKPKEPEVVVKPPEDVIKPPEVVKPLPPANNWMKPSGLVIGGVGVAAVIVGAIVYGIAPGAALGNNGAQIPFSVGSLPAAEARAGQQSAGIAVLGVGAAVAVAGAVMYLVAPDDKPAAVVSIAPSNSGAALVVGGKF
jgi:hypothetical protein